MTQLEEALVLCSKVKTYLAYENTDTRELIRKLAREEGVSHLVFLPSVFRRVDQGQPFPSAWTQGIEQEKGRLRFTQGDLRLIRMFSDIIGKSDRKTQIGGIELMEQLLQQAIASAKKIREEKGGLYRSLGILSGIGIAVLLI